MLKWFLGIFLAGGLGASSIQAVNLDISSVPLYLGGSVEPNIMVTMDDSASMQMEIMPDPSKLYYYFLFPRPDGVYGGGTLFNNVPDFEDDNYYNFFNRSSNNNVIFYDPDVTYVPWSNADGTKMADADPTAALYNPVDSSFGSLNLKAQQTDSSPCWFDKNIKLDYSGGSPKDINNYHVYDSSCKYAYSYWPITYYIYNSGLTNVRSSYTRVQITSATAASTTFTSPGGIVRTRDEEIQNFANWFQYYRSRILTARAGIGQAFAKQGTSMRVGFSAINQGTTTIDGVSSNSTLVLGLRAFSGSDRTTFFDKLYGDAIEGGTPLKQALYDVGKYFERTDDKGPWSATPGTTNTTAHLSCRQNYNILMTDGYWTDSSSFGIGNVDNTAGSTITGPDSNSFQYTPDNPYKDVWSETLADIGMYFWNRDLRTDLTNNVPTNSQDDAFWQHLVNYTVGLGVNGSLDPVTDWADIKDGKTVWPDPTAASANKIDDLWHTAVNSRGQYFSASSSEDFGNALNGILSIIDDRTSSATSIALDSGTVSSSGKVYQARFDSGDWTGQLLAYAVHSNGSLAATATWDAADKLPLAGSRVIITYDGTNGQPFRWSNISAAQKSLIGSENVLNYLRGSQSNEVSNGGSLRNRTSLLGDIIHSSPTYVGPPSLRYPDNWGTNQPENNALYSSFKTTYANRQAMIYSGANDGMLHAFNADTGVEEFAYVPNAVMGKLADLSNTGYSHKYYVDGDMSVVDAFFNSSWHTVLVGSLRGGGQGIFALDVTDPNDFASESGAATKVLWEFSDSDDADLGYTYGQPSIVRLQNGKWAAVFSGGYNNTYDDDGDGGTTSDSTTGNAVLYIVDLADGSLIKKFDTKKGSVDDPTGNNRPNGLSTPSVIDIDNDFIVDAIYSGDLFGNVWKIDVSNSSTGSWKFAYKSGAAPQPIYTACAAATCNTTNSQPITTQIQVVRHSTLNGYLLLFGTGKYFEVGDSSALNQTTQSFYAIWDKAAASLTSFDRSNLLEQKIIKEVTSGSYEYRITTTNTMDWTNYNGWYLDLINTANVNTDNKGERQVSDSIVRNGRVIFTTLLPSEDACDFGGSGWLMELDLYSGARLSYSPFDVNGDAVFTSADYINVGDIDGDGKDDYVAASGKKSKVGIISTPGIATGEGGDTEYKYTSGSTGDIEVTTENPGPSFSGRQSWWQLDFIFR